MKCIQERIVQLSLMLSLMLVVSCTELTFELEDNAKQCFHEVIKKDTKCTLEFQVMLQGEKFLLVNLLFVFIFSVLSFVHELKDTIGIAMIRALTR